MLKEKWSAISVVLLVAELHRIESAVGKKIKIEVFFLFFERQCIGSSGGFDKHRIKKPWPNKHKTVLLVNEANPKAIKEVLS